MSNIFCHEHRNQVVRTNAVDNLRTVWEGVSWSQVPHFARVSSTAILKKTNSIATADASRSYSLLSRGHWFLENFPICHWNSRQSSFTENNQESQRNQVDCFMVPCSMLCFDVLHGVVSHLLASIVTPFSGAIEALVWESAKVTLFGVCGDSLCEKRWCEAQRLQQLGT